MSLDPQRTAADPRASAFVSANAGAGKTTTLVARVARLLLAGAEPSAILCVTYTKAAAAEMQRRLYHTLGGWAVKPDHELAADLARLGETGQDLPRARKLFAKALETPGGLKIQTVHAFCERLLRRFPLEAGVAPGFKVMEDAAAAETAAAARALIARLAMAGDNAELSEAYARFSVQLAFDDFEAMFAAFEDRREAIARFVGPYAETGGLPEAVAALAGVDKLRDAEAVELEAVSPPALDPAAWLRAARALAAGNDKTDQPMGLKFQAVAEAALVGVPMLETVRGVFFTGSGEPRARLATKAVDPAVCDWLRDEQARLEAAFEEARAQRVADDTLQALRLAWLYGRAYEAEKAARGALDFADLISRTRALLAERPDAAWVLYKLDGGVDHLLVDEAQDTAPDQWEIVRQLTADFFSGDGAGERPALRTVFAVGDEKQSIFSFQGAAPEYLQRETAYYEAQVAGGGGTFHALRMIDSWRSAPGVLGYVDGVFAPPALLAGLRARPELAERDLGEDDLLRHIAKRAEAGGAVDLWPLERETEAEDRQAWDAPLDMAVAGNAYQRLAEKIAAEIEAMVARGEAVHDPRTHELRAVGYGDVLILVRKRKQLFEELIRALRRRGVPVAGADRLALSEHIAFDDLLALGRFVLFPEDDLTLAALLRSPFCDLGEDQLFALAQPRKGSLWRALQQSEHEAAKAFLEWALKTGRERPPFDFYGRVLSRLDGEGRSMRARLSTRLGSEALDAADEFLAEALGAEQRGVHDLEGLVDALSRLKLVIKREMDEPKGEVRVMTAHGAKGLEAPVVFLPETVGAGAARGSPLLQTEDGGFLWCASKASDCPASRAARERREKKAEDEALRLLYVALTRARDRLIVAGRVNAVAKEDKLKGWWPHLCAAFERLEGVRAAASAAGIEVRRYGADPQLVPPAKPCAAAQTTVPDWALRPAPPEPAVARYAAPSTLAEAGKGPAPSPLARANGLGRFRRGLVIHRLLEVLPDLAPESWDAAAERLLAKEPDLTPDQRAEIAGAALAVLRDPRFAEVFGPGSRSEAAVAGAARDLPEGLSISGRVDRMLVTPERILVADFKSNRPAPTAVEDADPAYLTQMAVYVAVLREAFPGRAVEAALVWTDGPGLMPIPEHVIADQLAQLKRSS